ncbi:MAG: hypothetical protein ACJAYU_004466 [Bradymonadia bacterium]|jgi:hypothetical protein
MLLFSHIWTRFLKPKASHWSRIERFGAHERR